MGDDWYGHRDPLTGEPQGDREEMTSWDHSLLNAFQTIEDYTDSKSGIPEWVLDDERVVVDAIRKVNKFQRSIDERTKGTDKKPYKPIPGEYFTPEVHSREFDEEGKEVFNTFREWVEKSIAKEQD
jgi:hypothetical protein